MDKTGASTQGASSGGGPTAFKFGTPGDKSETPTRKLFAAPEVKLSNSSLSKNAGNSAFGEARRTLPK